MIYLMGYIENVDNISNIIIKKHITEDVYRFHLQELAEVSKINAMTDVYNLA
jgi:hypothetical protein